MRKLAVLTVLGGLICGGLFGCQSPTATPAAAPVTSDAAAPKPADKVGVSTVGGQPGMNPGYSGAVGSKVK